MSNALADKDNVHPTTKARVLEVAERIGYQASIVARALRKQRTFTIGVLLSDVTNPSSPDFLRGVESVAEEADCSLLICNSDGDVHKQAQQMQALLARQVDGLVLISQHCEPESIKRLLDQAPAYVLLQRRDLERRGDYVGGDNAMGIGEALDHLFDNGHRRIAFLHGPGSSSSAWERRAAYLAGMQDRGLRPHDEWIVETDYSVEGGRASAQALFALPEPPTAIIASSDMNAIGVMSAAKKAGIDVPSRLSIIGLDNIDLAALPLIELTTIALPRREMGRAAASMLLERIRGEYAAPPKNILFPMNLVVRQTTSAALDSSRGSRN